MMMSTYDVVDVWHGIRVTWQPLMVWLDDPASHASHHHRMTMHRHHHTMIVWLLWLVLVWAIRIDQRVHVRVIRVWVWYDYWPMQP